MVNSATQSCSVEQLKSRDTYKRYCIFKLPLYSGTTHRCPASILCRMKAGYTSLQVLTASVSERKERYKKVIKLPYANSSITVCSTLSPGALEESFSSMHWQGEFPRRQSFFFKRFRMEVTNSRPKQKQVTGKTNGAEKHWEALLHCT